MPFKEWYGSLFIEWVFHEIWSLFENPMMMVQFSGQNYSMLQNLLSIFISLLPGFGNINNSHVKLHNFSFIFLDVSNFLWVLTTVDGEGREQINLKSCLFLPGGFCSIVNFFSMKMFNCTQGWANECSAVLYSQEILSK